MNGSGYVVTHAGGEGVETTYAVEFLASGARRRTTTLPDGTEEITEIDIDGSRTVTQPAGIEHEEQRGPDPRFGMQAPVAETATVSTPGGLTASLSGTRTATLSEPTNVLSLSSQTETVTVNGRTLTRVWDASTRTLTETSAAGRVTTTVLDTEGRPVQQQVGTLTPTQFSYDANGRMSGLARGSRVTTMTYDSDSFVDSVTDAANRTVGFEYDDAGRVIEQELPDLRVIGFEYDANGNLTSLTPPGRPAHGFTYPPRGQLQYYWPPQPQPLPQLAEPRTRYHYYLDGRLSRITRPDGEQINLTYDPETGQLLVQATAAGQVVYSYDTATGNLSTIGAPGETLTYAYDGSLPLSETWSGTVAGSVSRAYDSSFRVMEQRVNGAYAVTFAYDDDDLLTAAGALALVPDSATGLLTGTALGNITDSYGYNPFGEVMSYAASVSGTPLFGVQYVRDDLGRIATKTETLGAVTNSYAYTYDPAGRLTDVTTNNSLTAHYDYDANGNRVGGFNQVCGLIGNAEIDAQDRLLAFDCGVATASYTYTDNGELESKTVSYPNSQPPDIVTTYQYDLFGNLRSVTLPTGGIGYVIDGQNRRVGKRINGTLVGGWLYDGQLRIVAELDGNNAVVLRFVYASKTNVPDYMLSGGVTYRLISDHLGSVRLVVNAATGVVAQRLDYDEFGNVLADTSPGFQPVGSAGGLYDADTGLVRFGARDYDPVTGRWTAKDPIGFSGGDPNLGSSGIRVGRKWGA